MSQNLLVERLKFAKRELTALKTAHRRGLGLLKVYKYSYTISPAGDTDFYWLTLDLNVSISSYPFVRLYIYTDDITDSFLSTEQEFEYKNNGNTAEFRFVMYGTLRFNIAVYSTSPVTSMSYNWSLS